MYCNFTLPIDLTPKGIPFAAKSFRKVLLKSKFGLIQQDLEKYFSVCGTNNNLVKELYEKNT